MPIFSENDVDTTCETMNDLDVVVRKNIILNKIERKELIQTFTNYHVNVRKKKLRLAQHAAQNDYKALRRGNLNYKHFTYMCHCISHIRPKLNSIVKVSFGGITVTSV